MFDIISLFCRLVNTFLAIYCEKVKSVLPAFKKTKRDSRGVCSTQALFKSLIYYNIFMVNIPYSQ